MKKLTGSDRARRDRAYLLLASQYGQNPDFMEDFSQLVRGHCPILQYLSNPATGMWPNGLNPVGLDMDGVEAWWNCLEEPAHCRTYRARPGEPDSDRMLREVAEDARILAQDWGLRAPWGPGLVLQNGIQSFFGGRRRPLFVAWDSNVRSYRIEPGDLDVELRDSYDPTKEHRREVLERVANKLGELMNDVEATIGFTKWPSVGGKSSLEEHTKWLYLAICPNKSLGRPLTNREIKESSEIWNESTASKSLNRVAKLLQLGTGRKPGRPAKP